MGARLAHKPVPGDALTKALPLEIAAQPPLAQAAYALFLDKPGRSFASIARDLGVSPDSIRRFSNAGRWQLHLRDRLLRTPEHLAVMAKEEARRSRAVGLNNNRIFEGAIDASLQGLIEVDDEGNVKLKPGVQPADVEKLARARQTHVKTTQLLTGEAAAMQRSAAAAGATRIVLGGSVSPQPITIEADSSPA